jgi:bifunctional DNA-binding transcriptional regulator/antitoxin component of YhaV-PrlF toxin-antitoxin module
VTYHAEAIAGGRVAIPADLRRQPGIRDGDPVVPERDNYIRPIR